MNTNNSTFKMHVHTKRVFSNIYKHFQPFNINSIKSQSNKAKYDNL